MSGAGASARGGKRVGGRRGTGLETDGEHRGVRVPAHPVHDDDSDVEKLGDIRVAIIGAGAGAGAALAAGAPSVTVGSDGVLVPVSADSSTAALIPDAHKNSEEYEKVPMSPVTPVTPSSALMEEISLPEVAVLLKGNGGARLRDLDEEEHQRT